MQKSEILYEPLPIGRMGVRKDTEEVVIANDFSCFAYMLEEYVSFGVVGIAMPKSAPEIGTLDHMPALLRKRIKIVDDDYEIEAVHRLLFDLRKEFCIEISDDALHFTFPKELSIEFRKYMVQAHTDVKRMALGFNSGLQVDMDPRLSLAAFRYLRKKSTKSQSRIVMAQLEALLKIYDDVSFSAPVLPKDHSPDELVSIFDRLINDSSYLEYSDSVSQLADPSTRNQALVRLRELERNVRSNSFISTGWNYLAKVIHAWSGVPIPESSEISSIVNGRSLPILISMNTARQNAVEMWKNSDLKNTPLRRDGKPIGDGKIHWLPPLDSMEVHTPGNSTAQLGTVGELLSALEKAQIMVDGNDETSIDARSC